MVFQLDFKGPYRNIRMRLGNAFVVCDLYGSHHFLAFLSYFELKIPFSRSLNVILVL